MTRPKADSGTFICPDRLYTRRAFLRAAGLGDNTLRDARRRGVELPMLSLGNGRQHYVRGADGIRWIEELAKAASQNGNEHAKIKPTKTH